MNTPNTESINTNPFSRCFAGLDLLFKHNQTMAIVILIISLSYSVLQFVGNFLPSGRAPENPAVIAAPEPVNIALLLGILIPVILVASVVAMVISTYYTGVINYVAWKTSRRETTTFSEAVREVSKRFWTILAVQILVGLRVIGGYLLFIVPGIRASLRYQMVFFPVFDEGLNARNAIKRMKRLAKNHLMEVFGVMTVATIIPIVGTLLSVGGEAIFYPELKRAIDDNIVYPKIHWLNYIGFILLAVILSLLILLVLGAFLLLAR